MNNDELLVAIKDMFDKKVDEVKQHTETIVEKLHCDIKAIAKGYSILDRKIDNVHKELVETRTELKKEVAVVKEYVTNVDKKLNEHDVILKRVK